MYRTCPPSVESPNLTDSENPDFVTVQLKFAEPKANESKTSRLKNRIPSQFVASITIALPAQLCPSVCFQNLCFLPSSLAYYAPGCFLF